MSGSSLYVPLCHRHTRALFNGLVANWCSHFRQNTVATIEQQAGEKWKKRENEIKNCTNDKNIERLLARDRMTNSNKIYNFHLLLFLCIHFDMLANMFAITLERHSSLTHVSLRCHIFHFFFCSVRCPFASITFYFQCAFHTHLLAIAAKRASGKRSMERKCTQII